MIFIKDLGTRPTGNSNRTKRYYKCKCNSCGNEVEIASYQYNNNPDAVCKICSAKLVGEQNRLKAAEKFIAKCIEIHGSKYDYTDTKYVKNQEKVSIHCNTCGTNFTQRPADHKRGHGCPNCKTNGGWSYSDWEQAGKGKDDFKVYIVECWNDQERFVKIGKTFNTLAKRFNGTSNMAYEWLCIKEIKGSAKFICNLEQELHILFKQDKYIPKLAFHGVTECYNLETKKDILEYLTRYT